MKQSQNKNAPLTIGILGGGQLAKIFLDIKI